MAKYLLDQIQSISKFSFKISFDKFVRINNKKLDVKHKPEYINFNNNT